MIRASMPTRPSLSYALSLISACCLLLAGSSTALASPAPVYVHENGANDFLEFVVAVRPGQPVVWVNEDTGSHAIEGYNPLTGKTSKTLYKNPLPGTPGPGHGVHTYRHIFHKEGIYYYYCPIHAELKKVYPQAGSWVQPAKKPDIPGFGGVMAGEIIVTTDRALLRDDPPTSHKKILPKFFGG